MSEVSAEPKTTEKHAKLKESIESIHSSANRIEQLTGRVQDHVDELIGTTPKDSESGDKDVASGGLYHDLDRAASRLEEKLNYLEEEVNRLINNT